MSNGLSAASSISMRSIRLHERARIHPSPAMYPAKGFSKLFEIIEGTVASIPRKVDASTSARIPSDRHRQCPLHLRWCLLRSRTNHRATNWQAGDGLWCGNHQKRREKPQRTSRRCGQEDLLKFGLIPEFIGRLPVVATLMELDEDALIKVLTEPKNALVSNIEALLYR